YDNGVIHVLDASRSVTVASSLLSNEQRDKLLNDTVSEYQQLREDFEKKKTIKTYLDFEKASANKTAIDWSAYEPVKPQFTGTRVLQQVPLNELVPFIDWGPFFIAWEL
ncbi:methionine synthase, partial [Flavihumibacter sediminis]|nr:methionine synthase [Flavihumibacter sediminis]